MIIIVRIFLALANFCIPQLDIAVVQDGTASWVVI